MRWTDAQASIVLQAAFHAGRLHEQWALRQAEMAVDVSWIHVDREAYVRHQKALDDAQRAHWASRDAERRAAGELVWIGIENMTPAGRAAAYRALLDSWEAKE